MIYLYAIGIYVLVGLIVAIGSVAYAMYSYPFQPVQGSWFRRQYNLFRSIVNVWPNMLVVAAVWPALPIGLIVRLYKRLFI